MRCPKCNRLYVKQNNIDYIKANGYCTSMPCQARNNPNRNPASQATKQIDVATLPGLKIGDQVRPIKDFPIVSRKDTGVIVEPAEFQIEIEGKPIPCKGWKVIFSTVTGQAGISRDLVGEPILCRNEDLEIAVFVCECGNKHNPIGQGHSHWCDLFRSEF